MTTDWASQVSGPIPNHRIYSERNDVYPQKKVNKLNIEGKGYIGSFSNRIVSPKDHLRENVKRMREIQRASRLRQEESRQQRGPFKSTSRPVSCISTARCVQEQNTRDNSSTFNNHSADSVSSYTDTFDKRIRSSSARPGSRTEISRSGMTSPVVSNRDYLRAHEKTGPPLDLNTYPAPHLRKEVYDAKISVPRASTAREVQLIRRDVDFVRANAYAASSARLRRSPSADSLLINQIQEDEKRKQYKRGETPSYYRINAYMTEDFTPNRERSKSGPDNTSSLHFDMVLSDTKSWHKSYPDKQCSCHTRRLDLMSRGLDIIILNKKNIELIKEFHEFDKATFHIKTCPFNFPHLSLLNDSDGSSCHSRLILYQSREYSDNVFDQLNSGISVHLLLLINQLEDHGEIDFNDDHQQYFLRANCYKQLENGMQQALGSKCSIRNLAHLHHVTRKIVVMSVIPTKRIVLRLVRRRKQWEEDEQLALANRPDPDQPKGHRKLSEKERKDTLGLLKSTEKDMLTELGRLPIRTDTLKLRTMKQEIERKLSEIEEAIKIFSKPKVFVRIDT